MVQRDLIFDVGLHKGDDTAYYLRKGFRVVAFEANPYLVKACRERFAKQLSRGSLTIVEGAIVEPGYQHGDSIVFYHHPATSVWGTVVADWAERNRQRGESIEELEVPVVDFGRELRRYGMPHYLKIDIEGMDRACLQELQEFTERPHYVSLEAGLLSWRAEHEALRLLALLGYDRFKIVDQSNHTAWGSSMLTNEGIACDYDFELGSSGPFGADLSGQWRSWREIALVYRLLYAAYRSLGHNPEVQRGLAARGVRYVLREWFGWRISGWYDTHATKHSVLQVNSR